MQDRTDAGHDRCRTGQIQDRSDGQDRCRTDQIQDRMNADRMNADRRDAGRERCRILIFYFDNRTS